MKDSKKHTLIVGVLALYLLFPLIGTLLYSLAGKWNRTILPETWTFSWYVQLFQDDRFLTALGRSLFLISSSVVLSLCVMIPTIFIVLLYFPQREKLLQSITMIPYGIPGVVAAVGLLKFYSSSGLQITGTPWILIGAYMIAIMPFMYQGIRNSIYTVNAVELIQAAELLGASKVKAIYSVVIPNILKGIFVSALLGVAMLFGEFIFANMLVGGRYETLQIYLYQQLNKSGHMTSAIVITYYTFILLLTGVLLRLQRTR